jgi:hypothetical protein
MPVTKAHMILPTVAARDNFVTDAQAAIAGHTLKSGVQGFAAAAPEAGPTVARMKVSPTTDAAATNLMGQINTAGNSRSAQPGSFIRSVRDEGVLLAYRLW